MTSEKTTYKIGLAGCGRMGSAMTKGWRKAGIIETLDILDPNPVPADIKATDFMEAAAFMANAKNWDMLILAVKPQIMEEFCGSIAALTPKNLPLLSIVTGQSLGSFAKRFGDQQPIIRAMPNTPAAIGKGMTVACINGKVTTAQKAMATALLDTLGKTAWIDDEKQMDAVTALSGSGPAYVFYLIETMTQAGIDCGLDKHFATQLARETVIGAAALAETDAQTPALTLRENVTSPNGTTAAALSILMDGKFQEIMTTAIQKAAARSKELSK